MPVVLLASTAFVSAQPRTDSRLKEILAGNHDSLFRHVLDRPDSFRLQIIYTEINRDKQNRPSFKNYYFNYDPAVYFNPASMVKLPLAALALEKLNGLAKYGIDKNTAVRFDSSQSWQRPLRHDASSPDGYPSIAHLVKRALLISENDPYNRLYQFVGQQQINRNLHHKGFIQSRITRQFMGLSPDQNRHTNALRFIDSTGTVLYYQPAAANTDTFDFSRRILVGNAHYDRNDLLVPEPYDFTVHNMMSLGDMQTLLQAIMFPASMPEQRRFKLGQDDYQFLYRYLSQYPSETPYPKYDTAKFYDSYVKFFFRNNGKKMPEGVRVFNKVGWSYGFMTDASYVVDFNNNIEFMLAATIYVNSDGIINDGRYEYQSVAHPFLYQLGQTIYQHELKRKRKHQPDLSAFKIDYEKRDPADTGPAVTEVDN